MAAEDMKLYICDPDKNQTCSKIGCNSDRARNEGCYMTTNPEYAKLDGGGRAIVGFDAEEMVG